MLLRHTKLALGLMFVGLQIFSLPLNAVSLASEYLVALEEGCSEVGNGVLTLDFESHTYTFTADAEDERRDEEDSQRETGEFRFTCRGVITLRGPLEEWGTGRIQEDGRIVFGDTRRCGRGAVMTPKPRVSVWPFCSV